jgi:serine kinase of HPr protein (carbohydrate metabolism regulator)
MATGQGLISEDLAIFEQMRHQLIVWLRIEAITAGVEIAGLGPAQLLEALRQQERKEETRLQVVSSLLNLANQVIKSGAVSPLDYKQALMLHLMHTKR